MSTPPSTSSGLVAYIPAVLPRRDKRPPLKTRKDLLKLHDFQWQFETIGIYGSNSGTKMTHLKFNLMHSSTTKFMHRPEFREALDISEGLAVPLVVADFYGLLGRSGSTNQEVQSLCSMLLGRKIDLISVRDAGSPFSLGTAPKFLDETKFLSHITMRLVAARSQARLRGSRGSHVRERESYASPVVASRANKKYAEEFADSVEPHVREILSSTKARKSYTDIASELNSRGVSTRRGNKWTPTAARRVLQRLSIDLPTYQATSPD